jgi:uncharacterized phiE125 gp8 family phage protein
MHVHEPLRYGLRVKTAPTMEPLTLTEARAHARVDSFAEDGMLAGYLLAARMHLENITGKAFCTTTFVMTLDEFPRDELLELPRNPVQSIVGITYTDAAGATRTWAASQWQLDAARSVARLRPKSGYDWPSDVADQFAAISIEFVAGYSGPELIPQDLMQALRMFVAFYVDHRETAVLNDIPRELPWAAMALITQHRDPPV